MNTRSLRPKWTIGTMLLVVGWSSVVVWLNVRPRIEYDRHDDLHIYTSSYGFPFTIANGLLTSERPSLRFQPDYIWLTSYWPLAANAAIGLLAVVILAWTSRAILAAIRAFMSKPPPSNLNGD